MTVPSWFQAAIPSLNRLVAALVKPASAEESARPRRISDQRPVLEEMHADIDRLIASQARIYCDETCWALNYDDLRAEGYAKLAKIVSSGGLDRQPTRGHFFRYFKTAVANHFRSLVQRHRFTAKRTGQRTPDRKSTEASNHRKSVELSLNDEDAAIQVGDRPDFDSVERQRIADYMQLLLPVEKAVLAELIEPGDNTRFYAYVESFIGRAQNGPLAVNLRYESYAAGLGMSPREFRKIVLVIKAKINAYETMSTDATINEVRRKAVIQQLASIYNVHVPPETPDVVIARLFTVAARHNFELLTPDIAELLTEIGAKAPKAYSGVISCYGVLYQRNHPICLKCGLQDSCAVEAANFGLSKIALSRKLLGTRGMRIPAVLPTKATDQPTGPNISELDVLSHLDTHFARVNRHGETGYAIGDGESKKILFCVEQSSPLRLRFVNPSDALKERLMMLKRAWYAPAGLSADQLVTLIDMHATESATKDLQ